MTRIEDDEFLELFEQNLLDSEADKSYTLFVNHASKEATCEIYRRPMSEGKNANLYEYFTRGTWKDLHPERLFFAALDHDYRQSWDENVAEIALLAQETHGDDSSPSETMHWINKFPFPLANREYVYVRRGVVVGATYVVVSRHTTHSKKPVKSSPVRAEPMNMRLVLRAEGADTRFALHYAEDLGGSIPTWLINAAASKIVPAMIDQMYAKSRVYPADRLDKLRALHRSVLTPRDTSSSSSSSTTTTTAKTGEETKKQEDESPNDTSDTSTAAPAL